MNVTVRYLENVKFEAEARGHKLLCDQPVTNGGKDEAMTPPELLLASLGTCAGFYAVQYLKARQLPAAGVQVEVEAEKAAQPARLGRLTVNVTLPDLEERHREGVMRAVKSCLIHNTLTHAPEIEIHLTTPAVV